MNRTEIPLSQAYRAKAALCSEISPATLAVCTRKCCIEYKNHSGKEVIFNGVKPAKEHLTRAGPLRGVDHSVVAISKTMLLVSSATIKMGKSTHFTRAKHARGK
tara:strand:+ start:1623 stop:1934 length:312 start_codon:yes stop_codon:yes gene_type:complete